jgi:hypothetical protein
MTSIIVWGSIFNGFRDFLKDWGKSGKNLSFIGLFFSQLTSCMLCTSTWVGFFMGLFLSSPTALFFDNELNYRYTHWFFDGMFSAGFVWALNSIIEWFENK